MSKKRPLVVATVAATLRTAAEWLSGAEHELLLQIAKDAEHGWEDACCPLCEEVTCDDGCPLSTVRAEAIAEYERTHPPKEQP